MPLTCSVDLSHEDVHGGGGDHDDDGDPGDSTFEELLKKKLKAGQIEPNERPSRASV